MSAKLLMCLQNSCMQKSLKVCKTNDITIHYSYVCKTIDVSAKLMCAKANKSLQQSLNVCITNDITIY